MRSTHTLSASYMYSSTTLDPENVLASGRVFLEDSPGIGCRAWAWAWAWERERRVGPQALARCVFLYLLLERAVIGPVKPAVSFFGSGTGLPRILALRFLKEEGSRTQRPCSSGGNNSRAMPSGTHRRGEREKPES